MSYSRVGYLLSGDTFVWTKRGMLKIEELEESDDVLGLDLEKREATFEHMGDSPAKLRDDTVMRITTDVNELIVPEKTQLYTLIGGKKTASSISEGDSLDVFYRPETFGMLKDSYELNEVQYVHIGSKRIQVMEDFAYLLGTQAIVRRWVTHKIVMYLGSDLNLRKICYVLKKALQGANFRYGFDYRIFYRADQRKVIILDESPEKLIINMISELFQSQSMPELKRELPQNIPKALRVSPTMIMRQFMEGILDSCAGISKGGLVKFYTFARDNEIRRFIFCVLALFGIQPRYTFVSEPSWGFKIMTTYLALPKERPFDLKSLAIASEEGLASRTRDDVKIFSTVKHVAKLRRSQYLVPCPKENWDIIADLTPIHSQRLSLLDK